MSRLRLVQVAIGNLRNVSLEAADGEVVCLSGASGSGKSRLLRATADLEPHEGDVFIGQDEQGTMPGHAWRRRVMLVPADSQWWFDDVGAHFPSRARETVPECLGLGPDVMQWPVGRLSSGERQRLALWRALSMAPEALLLDEPTANLDDTMTRAVEDWLLEETRNRSLAVLWVAHDRSQIGRVARRHYRIHGSLLELADGSD